MLAKIFISLGILLAVFFAVLVIARGIPAVEDSAELIAISVCVVIALIPLCNRVRRQWHKMRQTMEVITPS